MLLEHGTLVLVLDGAQMNLYRNTGKALNAELELLSEKRQHIAQTAQLGSASPGRSFATVSDRRSAYESNDLHGQEEERFIKDSVDRLSETVLQDKRPAIIIASPIALGIARKHFSAALRKALVAEIDRDYAARPAKDVAALLSAYEVK
jgi:protein required for attachment to host cells